MAVSPLKLRIEGMDCGACATKIERVLSDLPGVSDVAVDYGRQALALDLDAAQTATGDVKAKIRALGYEPVDVGADGTQALPAASHAAWWQSRKAMMAATSGGLLAVAYLVSLLVPGWAGWLFGAAALAGMVPVARRAVAAARAGYPFSIETLMLVAALGAIAIGAVEEAAVVVFLFCVGEVLETIAAESARAGIRGLMDLMPQSARRLGEVGDQFETIPVEKLEVGDLALVVAGDRIPSDGVVAQGESEVDEAPITGESVPVPKQVGSAVYAGSINVYGELRVRITRRASDNTIARIIHIVEEAQSAKAPVVRFIDSFARYYTPAAMLVALLVIVIPPLLLGEDWQTWVYRGLAILLIACPCALVISTPAAIASGLAAGARRGLLIKGGAALETLGKVVTVAFDKTGTLTEGAPKVTDVISFSGEEGIVLALAAAVERGSNHPLARAIVGEAETRDLAIPQRVGGAVALPGKGVKAHITDGFVTVYSPRHARSQFKLNAPSHDQIERLERDGKTVVVVAKGETPMGLIALRDEPRLDAVEGLRRLNALGIRTVMLSGDNARTAEAIAAGLSMEVVAELLPEAKLERIAYYKASGPVAMVGDGINDAPALAAASVGIAMGAGTDVALEAADAALLKNQVTGIAELIVLSRATLTNIWQNITLALGLKSVFLLTTIFGTTALWMAILADTGATVLVTANALRLLRLRVRLPDVQ